MRSEKKNMRPVSHPTYKVLLEMVKGTFKVPVRERTKIEKNAAVLFWRHKSQLKVKVRNGTCTLLHGQKRVTIEESMAEMIRKGKSKLKGSGARLLAYHIKRKFSGVSERRVKKVLDQSETHGQLHGKFTNKPPLKYIQANAVFERVQIDLVQMSDVENEGQRFRYNLTVADVFSRYLICRPLEKKSSHIVAKAIKGVFEEHGWPKVIQCDNGSEFLGEVDKLFKNKKVKVVKSRPYHPQSQGKVERQHRILRKKMRYEMLKRRQSGFNWMACLPNVVNSINRQPKEVLSYQTPFAVYFGRDNDKSADLIRKRARQASIKCNERHRAVQIRKHPCTVYEHGARVLVRYPFGKRIPYKRYILKGKVLKRARDLSRYQVKFHKPDSSVARQWVSVEHVTSRTFEEERKRRKKSYEQLKEKEKRIRHRQKYYITIEGSNDDVPLVNMPTTDRIESAVRNGIIQIVDDPQEASNCQFNSISHQIRKVGLHRTGIQLRQMAVYHLKDHQEFYKNFISTPFDDYLNKMTDHNTFGDNLTLVTLARELNCQFIVVNSRGFEYDRVVSNTGTYDEDITTFTLGFYPEVHYVSIEIVNNNAFQNIVDGFTMPCNGELSSEEIEVGVDLSINSHGEQGGSTRSRAVEKIEGEGEVVDEEEEVELEDREGVEKGEEVEVTDVEEESVVESEEVDEKEEVEEGEATVEEEEEVDEGVEEEETTEKEVESDGEVQYEEEMKEGEETMEEIEEVVDKEELENGLEVENGEGVEEENVVEGDEVQEEVDGEEVEEEEEVEKDSEVEGDELGEWEKEVEEETVESEEEVETIDTEGGCDIAGEQGVGDNYNVDRSIPMLPYLPIRRILFFTIRLSPLMRYTLQRVSHRFAEIVRELGYPQIYISPSQAPLTAYVSTDLSVIRLNRMYGRHSGLMLRIQNLLSESGGRWYRAWLTLHDVGLGWFEITDVRWR